MDGRSQTGIVGCASIDDYLENRIKKHEKTRADKEADRIRHVSTCSAQTGPIFLAYKNSAALDEIIVKQTEKQPLYDFVSEDGIRHTVWTSDGADVDIAIEKAFKELDALYIADGHHRAASAVKVPASAPSVTVASAAGAIFIFSTTMSYGATLRLKTDASGLNASASLLATGAFIVYA